MSGRHQRARSRQQAAGGTLGKATDQRRNLARAIEAATAYCGSEDAELFGVVWDAQVAEHGYGEAAVGLIKGLLTLNGVLLQRLDEAEGTDGMAALTDIAAALHAK